MKFQIQKYYIILFLNCLLYKTHGNFFFFCKIHSINQLQNNYTFTPPKSVNICKKYEKHCVLELKSDFTDEEINYCIEGAYTGSFDDEQPAPISLIGEKQKISIEN